MGEATPGGFRSDGQGTDFNPRFPWGKRRCDPRGNGADGYFNPRFPWGKRLANHWEVALPIGFQSTLPVGEATPPRGVRPPRVGFQSTLPVGEATRKDYFVWLGQLYFNPRFPWGKRRAPFRIARSQSVFQSTLPVGEATQNNASHIRLFSFQSTLPVGEATYVTSHYGIRRNISIHASRGGSDRSLLLQILRPEHFNPRFPWGKRHPKFYALTDNLTISIHASRGGSDANAGSENKNRFISIHASRGGSDWIILLTSCSDGTFQSTLPVGEATRLGVPGKRWILFQSTLPVGEATGPDVPVGRTATFQSTLPVGEATFCLLRNKMKRLDFNPRFPWGKRRPSPTI